MCPGGLFFTRGLWTTRSCWSTTLLHPFRPFPWPFARAVAASSRKGIRWDRPLLSHPVLDAAELTCIPEALVRFLLLGWECRCLSGLRPGGPAPLSVPVRVCVKAVLVSPGWPSFWTFLNPALCIPVVLLCPGQQPYCGPGIAPGPGDTPGLRFWWGDGWCLQGGAAGARICVSLQLVTSWASVLRWAFRGGWSAGQRRQSPPRSPAEGAGSHSPPAAFLSRQAGDKAWDPCATAPVAGLMATAAFPGSYPSAYITGASSSLAKDLGPQTYRQTALSGQSEHQLEKNIQTQNFRKE